MLSNTKYIWLKNEKNLTDKQRKRLEELLQVEYLDTVKAYDMKLKLQDFYSRHKDYDEKTIFVFENMALDSCNSTMKEMQKFGEMLVRNAVEILDCVDAERSSAMLEGCNCKIEIIKDEARGFRNMKNFRDDLLLL